jgi:uncharacterized membrane protein
MPVVAVAVLLGSGVTAGVLFAVALSMIPALMAMPPGRYIYAHRLLGRNWDPTMPIVVTGSAALDLVMAVLARDSGPTVLFALAAACLVGVSLVSHLANVPINKRTRAVDPDNVPADWVDPRPVWRSWHLLRTALALVALALSSLAVAIS